MYILVRIRTSSCAPVQCTPFFICSCISSCAPVHLHERFKTLYILLHILMCSWPHVLMYTLMSSCTRYLLLYILICSWPHVLMYTLMSSCTPYLLLYILMCSCTPSWAHVQLICSCISSCAHVHPHELMYNLSAPVYPHVILYISFIQFIRNGPLVQVSLLEILVFLLYHGINGVANFI
jgi:hypothetical protein